jgi:membrane-associated phospholipid phosphatase
MRNLRSKTIPDLIAQSLLFADYGPNARFMMLIVWSTLAMFLVVDTIWLSFSGLTFAHENWGSITHVSLNIGLILVFCACVSYRLAEKTDRPGIFLRECSRRLRLFCAGGLAFTMLALLLITCCCLATSAALPLQDARLAEIDAKLGVDWVGFVTLVNSSSFISWTLVQAYHYTGQVLFVTLSWLCISGRGERFAECLALFCLASVALAVGMLILPAAGAYTHYQLPESAISHFGNKAGLWHYDLLTSLRTGAMSVINFDTPYINCLATFPSGHTMIGIITTYALRDRLWTFAPAAAFNVAMIASTIPVGGHHVLDLIASGLIVLGAVLLLRLPQKVRAGRDVSRRLPDLDSIQPASIRQSHEAFTSAAVYETQ